MTCEFIEWSRRTVGEQHLVVEVCLLNGRRCLVDQGGDVKNCARRAWAIDHPPQAPKSTPGGPTSPE